MQQSFQTQANENHRQLQVFEGYCNTLYAAGGAQRSTPAQIKDADENLKKFTENIQNIQLLRYFMENSNSKYVKYLSASAMKQLFSTHWTKIPLEEKIAIKDYMLQQLRDQGPSMDQEVLKMIIGLLAKIVKLTWFDHPEL